MKPRTGDGPLEATRGTRQLFMAGTRSREASGLAWLTPTEAAALVTTSGLPANALYSHTFR